MPLVNISESRILLGSYGVCKPSSLENPLLHRRDQDHRRSLSARMIAMDKSDMKTMPPCSFHVSRKIDGEFSLLIVDGDHAATVNPGGAVRIGLPVFEEAAALLQKSGKKSGIFACELYVHRTDQRPRVHDVCRVARQPESVNDLPSLRLAVFDILELDGKPLPPKYAQTWKNLESIFGDGKLIHPVETRLAKSPDEVEKIYEEWVEIQGAEGVVARSDEGGMYKIKPRRTLDVAIVGFTAGTDDRAGMIHDLLVALLRPEGTFHILGRVGGGFTEEQRRNFLSDLKDLAAESDYSEINDGVAYTMVNPKIAIEISCLDLITQTSRGATIDRMVLEWKYPKFTSIRRMPLASPISPQYIRLREDKAIHPRDLSVDQLVKTVEVARVDEDARKIASPRSELLKREVYTKTLKGQLMIRKLLLWRTNKEETGDFPSYVAYYTDFSPNRKSPLEREIRVSYSLEQIEQLWETMKSENIVKGWLPA